MKPGRLALALAIASVAALAAWPQSDEAGSDRSGLIRAEFWIDLEPVAKVGDIRPVPIETAAGSLLDEASWVISGLIWGFEFTYTPYDKLRGIRESFEIEAAGSISRGDPRLVPGQAKSAASTLSAFIEYRPDASQAALMESYGGGPWKPCQGIGRANELLGWDGRRAAYEDSLREALRSLLRSLEPNKPRLVRGRVAFERVPTILRGGGFYVVQSRVRAEVLELLPYEVY